MSGRARIQAANRSPAGPLASKDKLLAWVEDYVDREDLDAQRTLFLTKFASFASAAMESWAKVDTLARLSRCSERMLQKMREEFVALGVLENTGRFHTLPETGRKVPLYRWALFMTELSASDASGAPGAPEGEAGVHGNDPSGAQGVHPYIEPREPTPSDEGDGRARAAALDALLSRIEAAAPRRCLGNTIRDHALVALGERLDEGFDGEDLVAAARGWAADPAFKRKDLGLQFWLRDGRFRQWLPEGGAEAADGPSALEPGMLPAGEVAPWIATMAAVQARIGAQAFGSYLGPASLGQIGEALYLVAATGVAKDWIAAKCWAAVEQLWTAHDAARRPLTLVSKREFEALMRRSDSDVAGG